MTNTTDSNLAPLIDELGKLKAEMADLKKREDAIKAQIIEAGEGRHSGALFDVTVSTSERKTLDMDAVRAHLSPQFICKNTIRTTVTTVRVTARKG